MKLVVCALALVLSTLLIGCIADPGTIKELNERQSDIEQKLDNMSRQMTDIQRRFEIQEARIRNLERNYSEIYMKIGDIEESKPASKPRKERSADELYQDADSIYKQDQFQKAILAYQVFIDTYPDDGRVADAYLKQGLSLVKMGSNKSATYFFKTLIDRFPDSSEADTARQKLKEIESD